MILAKPVSDCAAQRGTHRRARRVRRDFITFCQVFSALSAFSAVRKCFFQTSHCMLAGTVLGSSNLILAVPQVRIGILSFQRGQADYRLCRHHGQAEVDTCITPCRMCLNPVWVDAERHVRASRSLPNLGFMDGSTCAPMGSHTWDTAPRRPTLPSETGSVSWPVIAKRRPTSKPWPT